MKGGQGGSEEDGGCRERRRGEREEGKEGAREGRGGEGGEEVIDGFRSQNRFQSKKYGRRPPVTIIPSELYSPEVRMRIDPLGS